MKYFQAMKTASVQQVPQQWPEIMRWVAAGEEVQVTEEDQVVAKVVPAKTTRDLSGHGLFR
jgi:antitoxin (DNA-binding transcriptional repressor) of toxin-antitoxin stability system